MRTLSTLSNSRGRPFLTGTVNSSTCRGGLFSASILSIVAFLTLDIFCMLITLSNTLVEMLSNAITAGESGHPLHNIRTYG
jgi:hypothetical protein